MLPQKLTSFAKLFDISIDDDLRIRQFAASLGGIDEQRPNTAINIDHMVALRGTRCKRHIIQLLFVFIEIKRERLEHIRALMKCHRPQRCAAFGPRKFDHSAEIQPIISSCGKVRTGDCVADQARPLMCGHPVPFDKACDVQHVPYLSTVSSFII